MRGNRISTMAIRNNNNKNNNNNVRAVRVLNKTQNVAVGEVARKNAESVSR
jgi:hypothetical protein